MTTQAMAKQLNVRNFDSDIDSSLKQAQMGVKVSPNLDENEAKYLVTKQAESDLRLAKKYMSIKKNDTARELIGKCTKTFLQLDETISEIIDLTEQLQ